MYVPCPENPRKLHPPLKVCQQKNKNGLTGICKTFLYPQQDSNLYLKFRKLSFYPLNYEG